MFSHESHVFKDMLTVMHTLIEHCIACAAGAVKQRPETERHKETQREAVRYWRPV